MYTCLTMMLHRSAPILRRDVFIHASRPNFASFLDNASQIQHEAINRAAMRGSFAAAPILRLNCLNFQKDHDCPETLHYNTSRLNSILL